jgi:hypothetical protein
MGFLRGAGVTILSILLFFVLLLGGLFASLTFSLKYENVQPKVYIIINQFVENQIGEEQIKDDFLFSANTYCQTNDEWVQDFGGYVIVFPCSVIQGGYNNTLDYGINYVINDLYYKEYNCTFLDCFKESDLPLFLISDYSQKFWKTLFFKFIIFLIVLFGLILLLVKNKPNSLIVLGSLMVPASLFILAFRKAGEFIISSSLSEGEGNIFSLIFGIFFSEASTVFLRILIIGAILIVVGIILRIIFSKSEEEKMENKPKEKKPVEKKPSKLKVSKKKKK